MRLLARQDIGLAILPPIVVIDELAKGQLYEACKLDGITEVFAVLPLKRRRPNPVLDGLLGQYE